MTNKTQLRASRTPAVFIDFAKKVLNKENDPYFIDPGHFGEMTAMIFSEIYTYSARDFNAMHGFAHHALHGGRRLMDPFYRAAQSGFGQVTADAKMRTQHWPEFFMGISSTIRSDSRIRDIVNKGTVLKCLPDLVWSIKPTAENVAVAPGILQALGNIPEAITGLDPAIATELVKRNIEKGGGPITSAPPIDEDARQRSLP